MIYWIQEATEAGAQGAASSTLPWAAISTLAGVLITLYYTNRREDSRQRHELEMKIREDRRQAYATMLRVTKKIEAVAPYENADVADAHSEIELLTDNPKLNGSAAALVDLLASARNVTWDLQQQGAKRPFSSDPNYHMARVKLDIERRNFLRLAKDELGSKPKRSWWRRMFFGA